MDFQIQAIIKYWALDEKQSIRNSDSNYGIDNAYTETLVVYGVQLCDAVVIVFLCHTINPQMHNVCLWPGSQVWLDLGALWEPEVLFLPSIKKVFVLCIKIANIHIMSFYRSQRMHGFSYKINWCLPNGTFPPWLHESSLYTTQQNMTKWLCSPKRSFSE